MIDVFLSASVPLPTRHAKFHGTADVIAIRESIKALVEVVLPIGRITFGAHPAITPLIALFVRQLGFGKDRLTLFQSSFFTGEMPLENNDFYDLRVVPGIAGNRDASLLAMRREMINSRAFVGAVLVGGMEGVLDEGGMFADYHPGVRILPVATTGAAAAIFYQRGGFPADLGVDMTYPTLFRKYLV